MKRNVIAIGAPASLHKLALLHELREYHPVRFIALAELTAPCHILIEVYSKAWLVYDAPKFTRVPLHATILCLNDLAAGSMPFKIPQAKVEAGYMGWRCALHPCDIFLLQRFTPKDIRLRIMCGSQIIETGMNQ